MATQSQSVAVWWADLRAMDVGLIALLDPVESERAATIDRPSDLGRFVLGACLLRVAVEAATDVPAARVVVERTCDECGDPHGRPRVRGTHVSVAHAGPLVVVATATVPVGVDVEAVSRGDDVAAWVRQEAGFKATGSRAVGDDVHLRELEAPLPGHLAAVAAVGVVEPVVHPVTESARLLRSLLTA